MRPVVRFLLVPTLGFMLASCGDGGGGGGGDAGHDSGGNGANCAPTAACTAAPACLATATNTPGATSSLRVSQIALNLPAALATPLVAGVIASGVMPERPACNLAGSGIINMLLQFDEVADTLTLGVSKPVADVSAGYAFIDESLGGAAVAPITVSAPIDGAGAFASTVGADLMVPIYIDPTMFLMVPLRQARVRGTLSADRNCIGSYNAAGLAPSNGCVPDETTPAFVTAGTIDGFVTLEDADTVTIDIFGKSLCVVLTGDTGDGGVPIKCARNGSAQIVASGDWCAATNSAATPGCADAMRVDWDFAASAVLIP